MKKTKPYEIIEAQTLKFTKTALPLEYHYLVMVERGKSSQMLENKIIIMLNPQKSGLTELTT